MNDDYKQALDMALKESIGKNENATKTIRRLFQYRFSPILQKHNDAGFDIINSISTHFSIPFRAVHICGSAQTGYSYFKHKEFSEETSDLDIAIVDPRLFQKYSEISFEVTHGYSDLTKFLKQNDMDNSEQYFKNLVRGYFRPDLMPHCTYKQDWFTFFNKLSNNHKKCFNNINGGIYFSETFFERKQFPIIQKYKESLK